MHQAAHWLPPGKKRTMCEKCIEIEKKIEHYRQIQRSISDQLTVDRTEELIMELEAQKAALHQE
jgi:hypothetical protein